MPTLGVNSGTGTKPPAGGVNSYEAMRALADDDALVRQATETRFRVRQTSKWRTHAADIERGMLKRGRMFDVIDWSQDQAILPFEEWART